MSVKKGDKCSVGGCSNVVRIRSIKRRGTEYWKVCDRHLREIKQAYLKEDVLKNFTI